MTAKKFVNITCVLFVMLPESNKWMNEWMNAVSSTLPAPWAAMSEATLSSSSSITMSGFILTGARQTLGPTYRQQRSSLDKSTICNIQHNDNNALSMLLTFSVHHVDWLATRQLSHAGLNFGQRVVVPRPVASGLYLRGVACAQWKGGGLLRV